MNTRIQRFIWLGVCLLLIATAALAQEEEIALMTGSYQLFHQLIRTLIFSSMYVLFYGAALVITLSYLKLFDGFETSTYLWIAALWFGGMVANFLAYKVTGHHFGAALLAMPIIFGWGVLINTRSWADLTLPDALRVAAVVAVVCAPYFGPTWMIGR